MSRHLLISVRFLSDRFHGRTDDGRAPEWPPSPMRLFQAILAGAKARWSDVRAEALAWLERQPPPLIAAIAPPDARPGRALLTYVPNNNDPGNNERTAKTIRPMLLNGDRLVEYAWPLHGGEDEARAGVVADCAGRLRALGWGIDLAIGHGRIVERAPHPADIRRLYRPAPLVRSGGIELRVPVAGSLTSLEAAHAAALRRFSESDVLRLEPAAPAFATVTYSTTVPRPFCAFRFVRDEDDPVAYRPRHIKQLAGQIRHLSAAAVEGVVDPEVVNGMILGHPKDRPRLSILPLPSIGHAHSDGLLRRVLLAEPFGSDGALCERLARALQGRAVIFEGACPCPASDLDEIGRGDGVLRRYVAEARTWASVTPVLLPGHNERRQQRRDHARAIDRAHSLIRKSLEQAGIHVWAEFEVDRVPYLAGALHARDYAPLDKLAHLPRYHVKLRFASLVAGPLSIGAGRHVGFSVLAACDEE